MTCLDSGAGRAQASGRPHLVPARHLGHQRDLLARLGVLGRLARAHIAAGYLARGPAVPGRELVHGAASAPSAETPRHAATRAGPSPVTRHVPGLGTGCWEAVPRWSWRGRSCGLAPLLPLLMSGWPARHLCQPRPLHLLGTHRLGAGRCSAGQPANLAGAGAERAEAEAPAGRPLVLATGDNATCLHAARSHERCGRVAGGRYEALDFPVVSETVMHQRYLTLFNRRIRFPAVGARPVRTRRHAPPCAADLAPSLAGAAPAAARGVRGAIKLYTNTLRMSAGLPVHWRAALPAALAPASALAALPGVRSCRQQQKASCCTRSAATAARARARRRLLQGARSAVTATRVSARGLSRPRAHRRWSMTMTSSATRRPTSTSASRSRSTRCLAAGAAARRAPARLGQSAARRARRRALDVWLETRAGRSATCLRLARTDGAASRQSVVGPCSAAARTRPRHCPRGAVSTLSGEKGLRCAKGQQQRCVRAT